MPLRLADIAAVTVMVCSIAATAVYVHTEMLASGDRSPFPMTAVFVPNSRAIARTDRAPDGHPAAVSVVEFVDYQCPACRLFQSAIGRVRARYGATLAISFRNFPLTQLHPYARDAAIAAECAARQHHLTEFQQVLFDGQPSMGITPWREYARRAGIGDVEAFGRCTHNPDVAHEVDNDIAVGERLGIRSTPSFVIGDSLYSNVPSPSALSAAIARAIDRAHRGAAD